MRTPPSPARRSVLRAGAWLAPVAVATTTAPAFALSEQEPEASITVNADVTVCVADPGDGGPMYVTLEPVGITIFRQDAETGEGLPTSSVTVSDVTLTVGNTGTDAVVSVEDAGSPALSSGSEGGSVEIFYSSFDSSRVMPWAIDGSAFSPDDDDSSQVTWTADAPWTIWDRGLTPDPEGGYFVVGLSLDLTVDGQTLSAQTTVYIGPDASCQVQRLSNHPAM